MSAAPNTTSVSRARTPQVIPGYQLERLVGRGGMGEVHEATQLSLGRTVAVKLLNPMLAMDESFVARFEKEAAALATLRHPNIVSILDKGGTETTYYLVMEFVDGASLREKMKAQLKPSVALRMMVEICRAIEYAHGRSVVHRDLKPENILFDEQSGGIAKVTDFGLATFVDNDHARYALTGTHVAMGTLAYMAPEQRTDARTTDGRADIYSLGVMLYELLTGELPMGTFDLPSQRKPGVDSRLDAIVARCLKPAPADRYPDVTTLIAELEPLIPSLAAQETAPLSTLQRIDRALRRGMLLALRTVQVLVVLLALGVLGVAWLRSGEKAAPVAPGVVLTRTAELGKPLTQNMTGRLDTSVSARSVSVGDGPDTLSLLVSGRPLFILGNTLAFPTQAGPSRVGLARVDVVGLEGEKARLQARVSAEPTEFTLKDRFRTLLYGQPPDTEAALLLLGSTGRYVALVHNGAGAPLKLEWTLGERRGTMLGHASPKEGVDLELTVDDLGVLRAFVGTGPDRRALAEPIYLGADWQKHFGEPPVPAFGCIEGKCRAEGLTYSIQREPPPLPMPPPPVLEEARQDKPPPPPQRTGTRASSTQRNKRSKK
jgi:hypothetical protein